MKSTVDTTGGVRPREADLIKVGNQKKKEEEKKMVGNNNTTISFFFFNFFIWLCWVLVASGGIFISACGIFSCVVMDLVP